MMPIKRLNYQTLVLATNQGLQLVRYLRGKKSEFRHQS